MEMKLDPNHPHFARLLASQQSVISAVMSTSAKVDETALRMKQDDKLSRILSKLKEVEDQDRDEYPNEQRETLPMPEPH